MSSVTLSVVRLQRFLVHISDTTWRYRQVEKDQSRWCFVDLVTFHLRVCLQSIGNRNLLGLEVGSLPQHWVSWVCGAHVARFRLFEHVTQKSNRAMMTTQGSRARLGFISFNGCVPDNKWAKWSQACPHTDGSCRASCGTMLWLYLALPQQATLYSEYGPMSGLPFSAVPFLFFVSFPPHLLRMLLLR